MNLRDIVKSTTVADWILLLMLIVLSLSGLFFVHKVLPQKNIVYIEVDSKPAYLLPLDENKVFSAQGLLGKTVIEVKNKMVRVTESPCQNKLCIKQGWIKRGSIFCIPNRVIVSIGTEGVNRAHLDAIAE